MAKRGGLVFILIFIAVSIIYFPFTSSDDVSSKISIRFSNVPPVLITNIPDFTWSRNTNLTEIFDLDDHFLDNETLTYNYTSVDNVSVVINTTSNRVSFYPDYNFYGLRNITFSASDGITTTNSNLVTLNITHDTIPPAWSSPSKDRSTVYQNLVIAFSAAWSDNVELGGYIFSIKQTADWVNQSLISFTGTQNTSSYPLQIGAPSGTIVFWKFYGFDAAGNMNVTDEQNFSVSASPSPPSDDDDDDDDDSGGTSTSTTTTSEKSDTTLRSGYSVDPSGPFAVDIVQGFQEIITIKITNTGNVDMSFNISIEGLEGVEIIINEPIFNLTAGASKTVTIEFRTDRRFMPDIYYGAIKVKSSIATEEIPVVITVKPFESGLDLNLTVLEEYKEVEPDSIVKANITLTNLKQVEERNVTFYYSITDFKGRVLDSGFEEFSFYSRSVTLERELRVPEAIKKGDYVFFARAISGEDTVIDSDFFEVGERFSIAAYIKSNFLFLIIFLVALLVSILMIVHYKNIERIRLLNLYLMVNELNKFLKQKQIDKAIEVYIRIKTAYGEPVSLTSLENKDELKKEMESLSKELNEKVFKNIKQIQEKVESDVSPNEEADKKPEEKIDGAEIKEKDKKVIEKTEVEKKEGKEIQKDLKKVEKKEVKEKKKIVSKEKTIDKKQVGGKKNEKKK